MVQRYLAKAWPVVLCAAVIIGLDQWTKQLVRAHIEVHTNIMPFPLLGEIFLLEHVHNKGAAFGILQNAGPVFLVTAIIVSLAIMISIHYIQPSQRFMQILMGMALGGALGNFIDRVTLGHVTDFLKVGIPGRAYWPTFNIADASIVVSVILLTILTWREDTAKAAARKAESSASEVNLMPEGPRPQSTDG